MDKQALEALIATETAQTAVRDAIAETLGDAMDCTRVWEAWQVGTMTQDDFCQVADDEQRLMEITSAALAALLSQVKEGGNA